MSGCSGRSESLAKMIADTFVKGPITITEIGVYDGTGAVNLIQSLKLKGYKVKYIGIDFFEDITYYKDVIEKSNPGIFKEMDRPSFLERINCSNVQKLIETECKDVTLIKGNSSVMIRKNSSILKQSDVFYIDGGHDYNSISGDWYRVKDIAKPGSLIILDDANIPDVAKLIFQIKRLKNSHQVLANRVSFLM